jgi:hypothetical protein
LPSLDESNDGARAGARTSQIPEEVD